MVKKLILMAVVCLILFTACDLFNPTDPDMLAKIDAEIAWANAARLNITVAYPQQWGTSLQRGTGRAGDTRVGYAFDIDFTPESEYAFIEWLAFDTNIINQNSDWMNRIDPERALGRIPRLTGIDLPKFDLNGGTGKMKVNSDNVLNITLVPIAKEQPRIVRSMPDDTTEIYFSGNSITITFAAPLDSDTVKFDRNHIRIWSQTILDTGALDERKPIDGLGINGSRRFANFSDDKNDSSYDNNTRTITIKPYTDTTGEFPVIGPDADSRIILELGHQITNAKGTGLDPVTITWTTGGELISITSGIAMYNDDDGSGIDVHWDYIGPAVNAELSWIVNGNPYSPSSGISELVSVTSGTGYYRIPVTPFDFINTNSLEQYEINILLFNQKGDEVEMDINPLLVYNIPNSQSGGGGEITFINNESELINVEGNGMFILMNDISVSNWIPLGRQEPFNGILYGGKKTITINGFAPLTFNNQGFGLFDSINSARIHNLNINYVNADVQLTQTLNFVRAGVIAGSMTGTYVIDNCTVTNSYAVKPPEQLEHLSVRLTVNGEGFGTPSIQISSLNETYNISSSIVYRVIYPKSGSYESGSFRNALEDTSINYIVFENVTSGVTTLVIDNPLIINRSLTIEGNGIILTRPENVHVDYRSQLLRVEGGSVNISRVHFKAGKASANGSAIYNSEANLILESCIFSENEITEGHAEGQVQQRSTIYLNRGNTTISGCTFFNNKNDVNHSYREVIYLTGNNTSLTLSGNLFYSNSMAPSTPVYRQNGTVITLGFNVFDSERLIEPLSYTYTTAATDSKKDGNLIDEHDFSPDVSLYNFINDEAWAAKNMPKTDFYGNVRTWPGAPGAVQAR